MKNLSEYTCPGMIKRSCSTQVFSSFALVSRSLVALLISAVVSRSLVRALSISICEFGQSQTGVNFKSSANKRGYLQTLCMGLVDLSAA